MMQSIELKSKERIYYAIVLDTILDSTLTDKNQKVFNSQVLLMNSLLERDAIPEARLRYFDDPEYNTGGTSKSRKQTLEDNCIDGDNIYSYPSFQPYLFYFINGADVPISVKEEAARLATQKNMFNDISEALYTFVFARKSDYIIVQPRDRFAEEYFKLLIEYSVPPVIAKSHRSRITKWGH